MADKIQFTFTNSAGKELTVGKNEFGIIDYSGIEAAEYEITKAENINSHGSYLKRRKIPERDISVTAEYKSREKGKSEMREFLISFFTPLSEGRLTVECAGRKRCIDYEVERFRYKQTNIYDRLQFQLELICLDPDFKSIEKIKVPIMTLVGGWKWPFTLPFRLKQYGPTKQNIYNNGHMETPVEIYFQGPAVAPKVINHRTGTYIQIERDLTADETLYISTMYRAITVEIIRGNEREDAWDYLENGSDFFRLQPGDNMIEYNSGSVRSKGVEIYYQERYLGV